MQQARLRVALCKKSQITPVPDPGEAPPYFWTKMRPEGPKSFSPAPPYLTVWMTGPPLCQGLDPAMNCALYLDMIMLHNASDSYSTSSPGTMKKTLGTKVTHNRAFPLRCPAAMLIYWNKRLKHLHEKRV